MLSLRILTAAVLLPPLVLALFYLPSVWVAACFGLFFAAGAWEWSGLTRVGGREARLVYCAALLSFGALLMAANRETTLGVLLVGTAWWLVALVELVRRPGVHEGWLDSIAARYLGGFLILVPAWVAMYYLHAADPRSPRILLFGLVLVWVADTTAYFVGHFFGRTKLAPAISPGKTVEGVIGAVTGVTLVAWIGGTLVWRYRGGELMWWIGLAIVTAFFSVLGDLLESKFKRIAGVKDSGRLLPGHGGALDRIDALTAALPVFALGWHWLFRTL